MWQPTVSSDELYHHGILGMKWGVRRYQNKDGSLTAAGRRRLNMGEHKNGLTDKQKETIKKTAKVAAAVIAVYATYKIATDPRVKVMAKAGAKAIKGMSTNKTLKPFINGSKYVAVNNAADAMSKAVIKTANISRATINRTPIKTANISRATINRTPIKTANISRTSFEPAESALKTASSLYKSSNPLNANSASKLKQYTNVHPNVKSDQDLMKAIEEGFKIAQAKSQSALKSADSSSKYAQELLKKNRSSLSDMKMSNMTMKDLYDLGF